MLEIAISTTNLLCLRVHPVCSRAIIGPILTSLSMYVDFWYLEQPVWRSGMSSVRGTNFASHS